MRDVVVPRGAARERLHSALYLSLQRARGRPVARYLRQLREWERLEPDAFRRLCAARLEDILRFAHARVPRYRSGPWASVHGSGVADITAWPVLERSVVQGEPEALLARPHNPKRYYRTTSGSTGRPLRVAVDACAAAWSWAGEYRAMDWLGLPLGASAVVLRPRTEGRLADWVHHRTLIPSTDLSAGRLARAVRELEEHRPAYVWGYVSAVYELAQAARFANPSAGPLVPFAKVLGEMMFPFQRETIERHLAERVIETYGCQEMGTVAHACLAGSLHIFAEQTLVEILCDGRPVAPGETGDIALTCLTNRTMPLIRYKVGDRGRLSPYPCPCGLPHPVLADVEGRVGDVLRSAAGVPVHGSALGAGLKGVLDRSPPGAIGRVLFEQHDPTRWTVLAEPGPRFEPAASARLAQVVTDNFGQSCSVVVRWVPEIPREPSGKFRYYRKAPAAIHASSTGSGNGAKGSVMHPQSLDLPQLPAPAAPMPVPELEPLGRPRFGTFVRNVDAMLYGYVRSAWALVKHERAAHSGVPLSRKADMWRRGFFAESSLIYDLEHNDPREYLTDYQHFMRCGVANAWGSFYQHKMVLRAFLLAAGFRQAETVALITPDQRILADPFGRARYVSGTELLGLLRGDGTASYIVKPEDGWCGEDIFLLACRDGEFVRQRGRSIEPFRLDAFFQEERAKQRPKHPRTTLIERRIEQGPFWRALFPGSANTIRILTLWAPGEPTPFVARAVQRIGTADTVPTDNWSGGGISAPVDPETGRMGAGRVHPLKAKKARQASGNGVAPQAGDDAQPAPIPVHPDTGARLEGAELPGWSVIRDTVLRAAGALPFNRMGGWDVLVDAEGVPVILEANGNSDVNLLQVHGGLLKDPRVRRFYAAFGAV